MLRPWSPVGDFLPGAAIVNTMTRKTTTVRVLLSSNSRCRALFVSTSTRTHCPVQRMRRDVFFHSNLPAARLFAEFCTDARDTVRRVTVKSISLIAASGRSTVFSKGLRTLLLLPSPPIPWPRSDTPFKRGSWGGGDRRGLGGQAPKMSLSPLTVKHTAEESGGELCEIFKV